MAKKAKRAKLTEEETEHLEQRFRQVRDQALCQWCEQAHGDDPQLKVAAQARLQLQIWLREKRREITILRQQRDACKADGDTNAMVTVRKKLKHAQCAMGMHMNMLREGIPTSTAVKARRKWVEKTHTLEELLDDRDLDKRSDFGVSRDNMFDSFADEEEDGGMLLEGGLGGIQLEDKDGGMTLEDGENASDSGEPTPDLSTTWAQHALYMQQRYRRTELPDFAIETKLAFQKKVFDQHVDRERQLCKAIESTPNSGTNSQYPTREGTSTSWNAVLVITTFSEHSLWELTSPMLWRCFEGGISWDFPQWVPQGLMRIQTVSSSSHIYFDFGARTFSTKRISIPANISTRRLVFSAQCHQTGANIDIEITFYAQGFVKVHFPVVNIIQPDMGCIILPVTTVELTGVWMGPVE